MTATTVSQFAVELKMPVSALLEQLGKAGVGKQGSADALTDQDKTRLLDYLRRAHGDESKTKITLTRKQTSEIKATDAHGRARTVQVEVRKKRVLVKRELVNTYRKRLPKCQRPRCRWRKSRLSNRSSSQRRPLSSRRHWLKRRRRSSSRLLKLHRSPKRCRSQLRSRRHHWLP